MAGGTPGFAQAKAAAAGKSARIAQYRKVAIAASGAGMAP